MKYPGFPLPTTLRRDAYRFGGGILNVVGPDGYNLATTSNDESSPHAWGEYRDAVADEVVRRWNQHVPLIQMISALRDRIAALEGKR